MIFMSHVPNENGKGATGDSRPGDGIDAGAAHRESAPVSQKSSWGRWAGHVVLGGVVFVGGAVFGPQLWQGYQTWRSGQERDRVEQAQAAVADRPVRYYTCGMHPWVVLAEPGNCPICHMKLEPIDPNKFTGEVAINPEITQNIGVRSELVKSGALMRTIRTVGTVEYAEPLVRDVNTKNGGWVQKLYIDRMGQQVKAGEPLFELYSPELYSAQEEYLLAYRNLQKNQDAYSQNLLDAARKRLSYFDISDAQIAALEQADKPSKSMAVMAQSDGVVIEKNINQGMRIESGMLLYRIADLSKVWMIATVYEYQLPFIYEGQTAVMSLPYIPGQTFEGKVSYIYPYLDQKLRQVKVRVEFENPAGLLKPGMYAEVELKSTLAQDRVMVSRSAIMDTGKRQMAFVDLGNGRFEPRQVHLGVETEAGQVEVLEGLKPGERVVVSGQFLLDSEASLRESLAKMIKGTGASSVEPVMMMQSHDGHGGMGMDGSGMQMAKPVASSDDKDQQIVALPKEVAVLLDKVLVEYLQVGDKLAGDTIDGVSGIAKQIDADVTAMMAVEIPDRPHFWHQHEEAATIRDKAQSLRDAKDIEQARLAYAQMSLAMTKLLRGVGVPASHEGVVQLLHCPMFRPDQGGTAWLQHAGDVRNPFFGASMLGCFDKREVMPVAKGSHEEHHP